MMTVRICYRRVDADKWHSQLYNHGTAHITCRTSARQNGEVTRATSICLKANRNASILRNKVFEHRNLLRNRRKKNPQFTSFGRHSVWFNQTQWQNVFLCLHADCRPLTFGNLRADTLIDLNSLALGLGPPEWCRFEQASHVECFREMTTWTNWIFITKIHAYHCIVTARIVFVPFQHMWAPYSHQILSGCVQHLSWSIVRAVLLLTVAIHAANAVPDAVAIIAVGRRLDGRIAGITAGEQNGL